MPDAAPTATMLSYVASRLAGRVVLAAERDRITVRGGTTRCKCERPWPPWLRGSTSRGPLMRACALEPVVVRGAKRKRVSARVLASEEREPPVVGPAEALQPEVAPHPIGSGLHPVGVGLESLPERALIQLCETPIEVG